MEKIFKNTIKILLIILSIYLIISSGYILFHINFNEVPDIVGSGFSESENTIRTFMGLPKTYSTYTGVSPKYLIHVFIKLAIAFTILFLVFKKKRKVR